jgi:hypothetical protein
MRMQQISAENQGNRRVQIFSSAQIKILKTRKVLKSSTPWPAPIALAQCSMCQCHICKEEEGK